MNAMCEHKTNSFFGGGKIFSWKFQILRTLLRFFLTIKRSLYARYAERFFLTIKRSKHATRGGFFLSTQRSLYAQMIAR